jgi:hypothetical protein
MVEFVDVRQVGPAQYADFQATRPLQGQSPYVINLALNFSEPTTGTSVNVLYNRFGRRMDAVGFLGSDVYEEPRDIVDLSLQQRLMWGMELRFSVKNLNNKARVLTRDNGIYEYTNTGVTYGLQLSTSL